MKKCHKKLEVCRNFRHLGIQGVPFYELHLDHTTVLLRTGKSKELDFTTNYLLGAQNALLSTKGASKSGFNRILNKQRFIREKLM